MRILQINKYLYPKGGSETYMFNLSNALMDMGHSVEYWGMQDNRNLVEDRYNCFAKNVDFKKLNNIEKLLNIHESIYSKINQKRISTILRKFEPDLVHVHNFNFQLTPSILKTIKSFNIPIVYTSHDSQLVCPFHRLYNYEKGKTCIKCVEGKYINCVKDKCFNNSLAASILGAFESYFYHSLDYYNRYIDVIISPSNFMADIIKNRFNNKIVVIPNFIESKITSTHSIKEDYVLYYGRISNEKGLFEVIEHFKKITKKLYIIGSGPEDYRIKSNKNIKYLGAKYGDELFDYVRKAKFVIQPSNGFENCPMTIIESFANGTPVIGANHSGFLELIEHGVNGYLVDFSQNTVAEEIERIFNNDYSNLPQNCIQTYKYKYSKDIHIRKIINLYKAMINGSLSSN